MGSTRSPGAGGGHGVTVGSGEPTGSGDAAATDSSSVRYRAAQTSRLYSRRTYARPDSPIAFRSAGSRASLHTASASAEASPGGTAMPAPASSSVSRASPSTPSTIGRDAAIASNIFDGSTV